jgi:hypothetical protein
VAAAPPGAGAACELLTEREVADAFGGAAPSPPSSEVSDITIDTSPGFTIAAGLGQDSCTYNAGPLLRGDHLGVGIETGGDLARFRAAPIDGLDFPAEALKPLTGIGDAAFEFVATAGFPLAWVTFLKGTSVVTLQLDTPGRADVQAAAVKLAAEAAARM